MTQAAQVIQLLKEGPKTLGRFRSTPVFYELRSRISELRSQGYDIRYHRVRNCKACVAQAFVCADSVGGQLNLSMCPARQHGENVYRLEAEPARVEANGQLVFA